MEKINKLIVIVLFFCSGCSDFLDVTPIDNLAGNNFWKTKADVESYTLSIYNRFRDATMINKPFIVASGDLRTAPTVLGSSHGDKNYVNNLRTNSLGELTTTYDGFAQITFWEDLYEVIQLSNILYDQIDDLAEGVLNDNEKLSYKAEAVFMRNLSYFFLIRNFGNVPYYTEAFHEDPEPRMDMISIIDNALIQLNTIKNDLPWTYENSAFKGSRGSRASVIALMMHLNMWAAGFSDSNQQNYYQNTSDLGAELVSENGGVYNLVPLENTNEIFSGGSSEGIFEIVQNVNAEEQFPLQSVYSNYVTSRPYTDYTIPIISYQPDFIRQIYPPTEIDERQSYWFIDLYTTDGSQQMIKFLNPYQDQSGQQISNAGNQIIFRYSELLLLRAEALAELGEDETALNIVNRIRERAGAGLFDSFGEGLKDDIYWERVRELMGEGYYYYDLVRTGKVVDGTYSYAPISRSAFNQGAWTWPIDPSALTDNPLIQLNNYWN